MSQFDGSELHSHLTRRVDGFYVSCSPSATRPRQNSCCFFSYKTKQLHLIAWPIYLQCLEIKEKWYDKAVGISKLLFQVKVILQEDGNLMGCDTNYAGAWCSQREDLTV
jgi:hypothetical protein